MKLLFLFTIFFRTGLFSVGGGLAILPFLLEFAIKYPEWLDRETIGNMLAAAQSLPGAIGANLAAYAGFNYAGITGAYTAALGVVSPSIITIIIISKTLNRIKENTIVKSVFCGLKPAAAALLSSAAISAISLSLHNPNANTLLMYIKPKESLCFIVLFALIAIFKKHPVIYIAAAGAAGYLLKL